MIEPPEFMLIIFAISVPSLLFFYILRRWFALREKRLDIEALNAAERAAQYVAHSRDVEARLAVVEQIVTDGGYQTATQIDALRAPRLTDGDKVQ
jgi:hypothetical protein